jgi:hypothetical protein
MSSQRPWILPGLRLEDLKTRLAEIVAIWREHGMVIFPGLLAGDARLAGYGAAVRYMFETILARHDATAPDPELSLGDLLVRVGQVAALDGRFVADMGTQPNKFAEANRLKFCDEVMDLLYAAWGQDAVLAVPQAGDTLHLFLPGESFNQYALPVHQDYPYLMQSPQQMTLYLGLSDRHADVGGLEYWPGSHRLGVLPAAFNENGHLDIVDHRRLLEDFEAETYSTGFGDLAVFDSLICHRSIANRTRDRARIVQLFRYSNLRNATAESYSWQSTAYPRRSVGFETAHPELFIAERPARAMQAGQVAPVAG